MLRTPPRSEAPALTQECTRAAERIARGSRSPATVAIALDPDDDKIHIGAWCPDLETLRDLLAKAVEQIDSGRPKVHDNRRIVD